MSLSMYVCMRACMYVCACMHACVRECVCVYWEMGVVWEESAGGN